MDCEEVRDQLVAFLGTSERAASPIPLARHLEGARTGKALLAERRPHSFTFCLNVPW